MDYYHDGIQPIWEIFSSSTDLQRQIDRDLFSSLLSRRTIGGSRHVFGHDGLGSATAQSDEAGAAFALRFFDAWGLTRPGGSGSWSGATLFAGGELEQARIYHMGARCYDPDVGRWLSEDPKQDQVFDPLSLNFLCVREQCPCNPC